EWMGCVRDRAALVVPGVPAILGDRHDDRRLQVTGTMRALGELGPGDHDLAVGPGDDELLVVEVVPGLDPGHHVRLAPGEAAVVGDADGHAGGRTDPAEDDVCVVDGAV